MSVVWERPLALALLLVPVALFLLALRRPAPERLVTGAWAFWKQRAVDPGSSPRRAARSLPPALWMRLLALVLATLALAGPQRSSPDPPWTVVVDTTPSMYLPRAAGRGPTRLDHGLARARERLDELGVEGARWVALGGPGATLDDGRLPTGERWLPGSAGGVGAAQPSALGVERLEWSEWDRPFTLFVTDGALEAHAADVLSTGGAALPGWVAARPAAAGWLGWWWDPAQSLLEQRALPSAPGREAASSSVFVAPGLPEPLQSFVRIWAEARSLRLVEERELADALHVLPGESGAGQGHSVPEAGRALLAPDALLAVDVDSAAFAVELAELLDVAVRAPASLVALAERRAAGPEGLVLADRTAAGWRDARIGASRSASPWLALAAAALVAASLAVSLAAPLVVGAAGLSRPWSRAPRTRTTQDRAEPRV